MSFERRHTQDSSPPRPRRALRDLARRTLLPAAGVWAAVTGTGLVIVGPLEDLPAEDVVNRELAAGRTPLLDTLTSVWSNIGATLFIIGGCAVAIAVVWWRTRQWWLAVVPAIAVSVQSSIFVTAAAVVGRARPDVEQLDVAPPTSSFPSGHVGASTAFYLTLALLARRVRSPALRRLATAVALLVPALVAYARLYRGMHHVSDVVVGVLLGTACAWLAWRSLRRDTGPATAAPERRTGPPGAGEPVGGPAGTRSTASGATRAGRRPWRAG